VNIAADYAGWCQLRDVKQKGLMSGLLRWIMRIPADERSAAWPWPARLTLMRLTDVFADKTRTKRTIG